jgi:hypothetical protein
VWYFLFVAPKTCRVSLVDANATTHSVIVSASSLLEAAAAAVAAFRHEGWAAEVLKPATVLRVEVQPPPVIHDVLLRTVEQWMAAPTPGPADRAARRRPEETAPALNAAARSKSR